MADSAIVIEIQSKGANRVKKDIDEVTNAGNKAQNTVAGLRTAFLALGGAAVAAGFIKLADTFTNLQNRMRLVTSSTEQLNSVTQQLFDIANSTRLSFESTAEVYARTALATKELGLSQQETLDFTKSLNQAVILSGASATESAAGLIQLSQGLASGTLRGDELRSVLEQLPAVADVISKSLGITRGELRQMGQDGKITADIIIEAFKQAAGELDANFATTVPTVGQAFTVLENSVMGFVAATNEATGATSILANFLIGLSQIIDALPKLFAVVGIGIAEFLSTATQGIMTFASVIQSVFAGIGAILEQAQRDFRSLAMGIQNFLADPTADGNFAAFEYNMSQGFGKAFQAAYDAARQKGIDFNADLEAGTKDTVNNLINYIGGVNGNADLNVKGTRTVKPTTGATKEELREQARLMREIEGLIQSTMTEEEKFAETIAKVNEAKAKGLITDQVANDLILKLTKQYDVLGNTIADSFDSALDNMVDGTGSALDVITGFFRETVNDIIKDSLNPLKQAFRDAVTGGGSSGGGGGLFGSLLGGIGGLFGGGGSNLFGSQGSISRLFQTGSSSFIGPLPAFADGGSMVIGGNSGVDQNLLSLNNQPIAKVGRGETLDITPAGGSRNGGGQNIVINQSINISTGVQQTVRAELQQLMPAIKQQAVQGVQEANMRGMTA